ELGSIEVSKNYRRLGIADALMEAALAGDAYQDVIVVAETIRWHWDLETSGGNPFVYRERLLARMRRFGVDEYGTDEAYVRADAANALVARIGPSCAPEHVQHFHGLRVVGRRLTPAVADRPTESSHVQTAPPTAMIATVLVGDYMTPDPVTLAPQ